jgi:hypothetical protein
MTDQTAKKNQHTVIVILWAALIMSAVMYLGLTFLMPRQNDIASTSTQQTYDATNSSLDGGSSATESLTSDSQSSSVAPTDPIGGILYPFGLAMSLAGLALGHARSLWRTAEKAKTLNILSLALCESCALMGLVIYILGKADATEARSMIVMAIVCMATLYPSPKKMHLA